MEILLTLVLLAPAVVLMERTHRRTRDLPRMPFSADAESAAASTYRRQVAELSQLRQLRQVQTSTMDVAVNERPVATRPTAAARLRRTMGVGFSPLGGWSGSASTVKTC